MFRLIFLLIVVTLSGCGEPVVDGDSPKAASASLKSMRENLREEQKKRFSMAVARIITKHDVEMMMKATEASQRLQVEMDLTAAGFLSPKILEVIDGKTAEEVVAYGLSIPEEESSRIWDEAIREKLNVPDE